MQRAWQQVQKVYDANRVVRQFQFHRSGEYALFGAVFRQALAGRSHRRHATDPRQGDGQPDDDPPAIAQQPAARTGVRRALPPHDAARRASVARHLDGAQGANFAGIW